MAPVTEKEIFQYADITCHSSRLETPTIVIEAVCDLVTDDHADTTIVERIALAFAEEWHLEDSCWEHW